MAVVLGIALVGAVSILLLPRETAGNEPSEADFPVRAVA